MRAEIANLADELKEGTTLLRRHLDWDEALVRLDELDSLSEDPKLWEEPERAQKIMRERNGLAARIDQVRDIETRLNDGVELAELAEAEGDESTIADVEKELQGLKDTVRRLQLEAMLSGEADRNNAFVELNAGAGGTESQDWAEMLMRMYTRWAEQHGYKVNLIQETEGEEAGIKSATLKLEGENAYGWLKTEAGVHRLVRISPYDSQARRHTSFASVWVYPEIDDSIEVDIQDKDLRIDTYRASGAGGQHVNRTESAIRITHLPTGIVVSCQTDRSQHRNRDTAFGMLRARLYELELQKRRAASDATEAAKTDIGWGHQIRSYVLQPYRMVKDLRTGVETSDTQGVLDGDLDPFLEASLARGVVGVATEVEDPV
ncbi:MAG TPA: peptide chain release factor 2 [Geminicoccus sp.]|uniref:peptide chain release factor 2 n=1 Tax=Geminicoccus sp. TaxID=2024832 RepID=UPI002E2F947B|nr:peptide chain release factor 2 [Geminicoccus sp.]HEX2525867.1 peptide chain release factor 2 [Geminicoccus sp.]